MNVYTFDSEGMLGNKIRVTADAVRKASVIDVIRSVTDHPHPRNVWGDLQKKFPEVAQKSCKFKFPGKGQRPTPVCDARGLVSIISLLSGKRAAKFREAGADLLVRYLGGDETLVTEVCQNRQVQEQLPVGSCLRMFGEDVEASLTCLISSATGVQDWTNSQVYIGQPAGKFSQVRAVGNDLPAGVNLEKAIILKTGYQLSEGRIKDHVKSFGGFALVDTFPTNCCSYAERQWKDTQLAQPRQTLKACF